MALFSRASGAGTALPLEPPRLVCTMIVLPPSSIKRDAKFIRELTPELGKFDEVNGPIFAAATVPLVDLVTETVSPMAREGNEGAPYHGPATLGYALGAFEKTMPAFTPGFTSTGWVSWAYSMKIQMSTRITRTDSEALILRGLIEWAIDAGRYMAMADVTAVALRPALFSELAGELQKIFGPEVAVDHLLNPPEI